ncbi:MAG TPA: SEC-C metal-binding domain-containing protein [Anaerolineae bacterium]|nr:SEC-C metal-binding domain-containing protein [Anaerolineae bacterium]
MDTPIDKENIGRNDPCYCGSGQKYKKCHMKEDKETMRERIAVDRAAVWLRRDTIKFARDERFHEAFAAGLLHYWNGLYDFDTFEEMNENEALRYFDWFLYDYHYTNQEGEEQPRLLDIYHQEKYDDLSSDQQNVLDDWRSAGAAGAYEFLRGEGNTFYLRDFFTDEEVTAHSAAGFAVLEPGDLLLIRLIPFHKRIQFSTTAAYIPKDEIGDLKEMMAAAKEQYMADNPDGDHVDFLRRNNYRIIHHALKKSEEQGRYPVARLDPDRTDRLTQAAVKRITKFVR